MVTMKFNLVNFVLETTSILLLLAVKSDVIRILYLLVRYKEFWFCVLCKMNLTKNVIFFDKFILDTC